MVGDLVLEGEGLCLEVCGGGLFRGSGGLSCLGNLFLSFQDEL